MGTSPAFLSNPNATTPYAPSGDFGTYQAGGTIDATGDGDAFGAYGPFNFSVWGAFTGTVTLERSFDGGTIWIPALLSNGDALSWTAPSSITLNEPERGVAYKVAATVDSGAVTWRASQ